jgi:hypothetical protein
MSADPATAATRTDRPSRARPANPVPGREDRSAERIRHQGPESLGWAALGPRTTGRSRTTAASNGQPTAQVSSHFRAFAQVVR